MADAGTLREVIVDGARLRYAEAGAGEPVVLLHGYPESHLTWRHQWPALARRYHVYAPDWFGWGASERDPALSHAYDDEVARLGRVLDAWGLDRINLLAHDYGGFLAVGFATAHPGRLRRLAILNSRAHRTFPEPYYALTALAGRLARTPGTREAFARLPWAAIHRAGMAMGWLHHAGGTRFRFEPEVLEAYVGWMGSPEGRRFVQRFFAQYRVEPRPELAEGLGRVRCPAAVVWGGRDPWCPVADAEDLARRLPDATLSVIAEAGHFVMEERPAEVLAALEALLAREAQP